MADEKGNKPESQQSPFGDDSDWDTELAAWDAALPIGGASVKPAARQERPDKTEPIVPLPPPDAESIQFAVEEIASNELAVQQMSSAAFTPFAGDDDDKTDSTVREMAGLEELSRAAEPVVQRSSTGEGSGLVVIPDLDELAAMSTNTAAPRLPMPPRPPSSPNLARVVSPDDEPSSERLLVSDGLPELSGVFSAEAILGSEAGSTTDPAIRAANPYEADLPREEPLPLELSLPSTPPVWAPRELARGLAHLASGDTATADSTGPDRYYWRDHLALWTDEVAASREEVPAFGPAIAMRALAAARAAEHSGQRELAQRFYQEAIEADPRSLRARRGHLVLREPGPLSGRAREELAALAAAAHDERPAYELILAEAAALDSNAAPGAAGEGAAEQLTAAARALASGALAPAAEALSSAARSLSGAAGKTLLLEAARLRELAQDGPGASALRAEARGESGSDAVDPELALGSLREAVALPADSAVEVIAAASGALGSPSLAAAALRWAARVARAAGDHARSRALIAKAGEQLASADIVNQGLPERDRIAVAAGTGDGTAPLSPEAQVISALRAASAAKASGEIEGALTLLRARLTSAPGAIPLALAAEMLGQDVQDPRLRAQAWALWAEGDPARRAFAHHLQAAALAEVGDATEAHAALAAVVKANPVDPAHWELAWSLLRQSERGEAAAVLEAATQAWAEIPGAEALTGILGERAGELRRSADPVGALGQTAALAPMSAAAGDDPAALVSQMLDANADVAAIAANLDASAPAGLSHRALEAAGWMIRAEKSAQALARLLERRAADTHPMSAAVAQLVRRLARRHAEPADRARLFAELAESEPVEAQKQALELQRGEALEAAGARAEATEIYRALLGGPFAGDADLALRRVLWGARDAAAVAGLCRDEADAQQGAGRATQAATSLVEQATAEAELAGDPGRAHATLQAARALDPANAEVRLGLMAAAFRAGRFDEAVSLLEEAATQDFASLKTALLAAALAIDEGRGSDKQAARLLDAALEGKGADAPLALLVRASIGFEPGAATPSLARAVVYEGFAQTLAALESSDRRAVATLLMRAAEIRQALGELDAAEKLLRDAIEKDPECLPAMVKLRRLLMARESWAAVVDAAEKEAAAARKPEHQGQAWLLAAAVAETKLDDPTRAKLLLRRVLDADPAQPEAFARLRQLFESRGDHAGLADLLMVRVRAASSPDQMSALRMERAALLAGAMGNRNAAKEELRALLAEQSQNVLALGRLAALELEDGAFAVAAELYIRQARFDRDPERLRDIFLAIGRIYLRRLPDAKLAIGAFERVLRLDGENREALESLSELYAKQNDLRRALAVTEPLIEREPDAQRRLPLLLRLANLWEKSGDGRRAGAALKRAAEECPRSLQAVGELARFYERAKETSARNVLLDSSISLLRADFRNNPGDLSALRTIIPLLRWRQRHACSMAAAQVLALLTTDEAERTEATNWAAPPKNGRRLSPIANPELEELLLPPAVPRGVRNVMRLLGPALARAWKPDLKRWEVGRSDRQSQGTGLRAIADPIAADLGVRGFDVYVSRARSRAVAVEPGESPAIVIGADLAALGPSALRFAFGQSLRLITTHFDVIAHGGPADAGLLLAGLIRQFVPEFRHPELSDTDVLAASSRVARALPKALRSELAPYAAEIATPLALEPFLVAVQESAARVGLLASGDLGAALAVLCAQHGQPLTPEGLSALPVAQALLDFAFSPEHEELVLALDAMA